MAMRRHVRYEPLGRSLAVAVWCGNEATPKQTFLVNESSSGLALQTDSTDGIAIGQNVLVDLRGSKVIGQIVWIKPAENGKSEIGVTFLNKR